MAGPKVSSIRRFHCISMCTVTATWNGAAITGPVLIYHDEILYMSETGPPSPSVGDPYRAGALVCRSDTDRQNAASWHWPHNYPVVTPPNMRDFQQVRTANNSVALIFRTSTYVPTTNRNRSGLWNCRQGDNEISVGLYHQSQNFGKPMTRDKTV